MPVARTDALQDADVPKEAKAVETAPEATSPESEPMKDEALAPPKEEGTKSTPPPVVRLTFDLTFTAMLITTHCLVREYLD